MPKRRIVSREEAKRKFPLGASVLFKGRDIGTVVGYVATNGDVEQGYEVLYVTTAVDHTRYPDRKFSQFTPRSNSFRAAPGWTIYVYRKHPSGIGSTFVREERTWIKPSFDHPLVDWYDETNGQWARWDGPKEKE